MGFLEYGSFSQNMGFMGFFAKYGSKIKNMGCGRYVNDPSALNSTGINQLGYLYWYNSTGITLLGWPMLWSNLRYIKWPFNP